jgi:PAS domain-containing protein
MDHAVAAGDHPAPEPPAIQQEVQRGAAVERQLRQANRALTALSRCNRAVIAASDEITLFREVCAILTQQAGYRLAWAGVPLHDPQKSVLPVAWAGFEDGYLETTHLSWADCERGRGPTGRCIRGRQPIAIADAHEDPSFAPWREEALRRGFHSCISLPVRSPRQLIGVLNVYATEVNAFSEEEIRLLLELADNLGFGIAMLRERAARERAQEAERKSQRRLFQFLDLLPVGVYILDASGAPYYANQQAVAILGRGIEGLTSVRDLVEAYGVFVTSTGAPYPVERFPVARALAGETATASDMEIKSPAGVVPIEVVAAPVKDAQGRVEFAVAAFQDVSARRRTGPAALPRRTAAQQ